MRPKKKREEKREFAGIEPKNKWIVDRIRKEGYLGMMFNKDDFMDAVVWAANIVYDYMDFFRAHRDRSVIPIGELPFLKDDLKNAHLLMIVYYKVKDNLVQFEEMKLSLFTMAKFQSVDTGDVEIIKKWDENMMLAQQKTDSGDLSGYDMASLHGTEEKYRRYAVMVSDEMKKYQEEIVKVPR
ncbi:MAG: hypothetical protein LBQ19_02800 [Synergistaceae bacterium]|nr:hypothetical protein [Synergistaceae bacterium]